MSQAFVRENDAQWLHEIAPSVSALIAYLTRENNGIRVYEKKIHIDPATGKEVHEMSNGLLNGKDKDGKWEITGSPR